MNPKYQPLFQPYTLNNGVTIKNRFTVAPLTIYDSGPDGEMTDADRRFWHDRFEGFGLYIMPFTNVHLSGIGFESPNAFDERHLPTLREYADMAHAQGAKAVVQIAHSGFRAAPSMTQGHEVIAPSGNVFDRIRTMTAQEITDMVGHYAYAPNWCCGQVLTVWKFTVPMAGRFSNFFPPPPIYAKMNGAAV